MAKSPLRDAEDVAVKSLVFERTRTKVLVAESAKFHKHANYYLARLKQFDYWITDQNQALKSLNKSAVKPLFSIRRSPLCLTFVSSSATSMVLS